MARKHKKTAGNGPGRPAGGGRAAVTAVVEPSRCPKCGSTNRGRYFQTLAQEFAGVLQDGRRYERIIRRRATCSDCGQVRIDKTYE